MCPRRSLWYKLIVLAVAFVLTLPVLTACSWEKGNTPTATPNATVTATVMPIPTAMPAATPFPTPSPTQQTSLLPRVAAITDPAWSGYAVRSSNQAVSFVTGSWTVPTVKRGLFSNSSAWVGIDGLDSDTVEQIGTDQSTTLFLTTFYAWYEMYPSRQVMLNPFSYPVHPGDLVTASVSSLNNVFTLSLTDTTQNWTFTTYHSANAQQTSAEWIMEAPALGLHFWEPILPLANFGTIYFTNCKATINDITSPINGFPSLAITMMSNGGVIKATPSQLTSDGTAFSVVKQP